MSVCWVGFGSGFGSFDPTLTALRAVVNLKERFAYPKGTRTPRARVSRRESIKDSPSEKLPVSSLRHRVFAYCDTGARANKYLSIAPAGRRPAQRGRGGRICRNP